MAQAEGPWKMEKNYRYMDSKNTTPLEFSVINAGNIREHLLSLAANAHMLWDMPEYSSDGFLFQFCEDYFGKQFARESAALYRDFFYAYWNQKKHDLPAFDRQYLFHDLRYKQAVRQLAAKFFEKVDLNPLEDYAHEQLPNRTFRIVPEDNGQTNQVEAIIAGTSRSRDLFAQVAHQADELYQKLPVEKRPFFNDNLRSQAFFMAHLNHCLHNYIQAYIETHEGRKVILLRDALVAAQAARASLYERAHGHFSTWYDEERIFDIDGFVESIAQTLAEVDSAW
jgi:REP element-mobilizing transposase RayT